MNYQDIERIAELEEGSNLEFKESTGQLDRSMETLCAFLNGDGGNILYGVKDNGKIIGQEVSDSTKRSIAEAVNRIEPFVELEIAYVSIPDTNKYVISIHAECTCSYLRNVLKVILSDSFSNFPTLYKKDKERAKKQVLYVFFAPFAFINFF